MLQYLRKEERMAVSTILCHCQYYKNKEGIL